MPSNEPMLPSEKFSWARERARSLESLKEAYETIHRRIVDGRAVEAIPVCETMVKMADAFGDALTLSEWPVCEACHGSAERVNPSETDRRVRCQDLPSVCLGNRHGRMHPVQLAEYVASLLPPSPEPEASSEESEGPEESEPESHEAP